MSSCEGHFVAGPALALTQARLRLASYRAEVIAKDKRIAELEAKVRRLLELLSQVFGSLTCECAPTDYGGERRCVRCQIHAVLYYFDRKLRGEEAPDGDEG